MASLSLVLVSLLISFFTWTSSAQLFEYQVTSVNQTSYGLEATLELVHGNNTYGTDISPLQLSVWMETESRLHVKIWDPNNSRWEVPNVITQSPPVNKPSTTDYLFSYTTSPFGFAVVRASDGDVLFNTTPPVSSWNFNGLVFEDQYLELTTQTPFGANIYGLGERVDPIRLNSDPGQLYTIFNVDVGTPTSLNLYGSHPFYLELRNNTGNSHGVLLFSSNGMDIYVGPDSSKTRGVINYKVIGGVLDFYFFTGPTPENVIQQYTELVGRPYFPPYWALGFHQCRWGYHNISEVENVVAQYASHNIPLDTMWTDIDYMDQYKDFTFDPINFPSEQVNSFVETLHSNGMHYILITDCGILNQQDYFAWEAGIEYNVFVKNTSGQPFIGKCWPGNTAWPDFSHPNSSIYWTQMISGFLDIVPVDGLWIDMNEISSFCSGQCFSEERKALVLPGSFDPNNPPYSINNRGNKSPLDTTTFLMDAEQYVSIQYNVHNMYGFMEANATKNALETIRGKRAVVVSRSTFIGHGAVASHWLGDNTSDWPDLYYSIPGILNFQMFGLPLVGADICGFNGATTEELCARWIELGAFYPFSRDHNAIGNPPQELYVWPTVAAIGREVLLTRYSLLPYYYTLFWSAHANGTTVARPLFFEFPTDINCVALDKQFMIGSGLMISPVLEQNATTVEAYFPEGTWFNLWNYTRIYGPFTVTLDAPLEVIQVHIRGGTVLPRQQPSLTTTLTRLNPYYLVVALQSTSSSQYATATGQLYIDDGDSLNTYEDGLYSLFSYSAVYDTSSSSGKFSTTIIQNNYDTSTLIYNEMIVLGVFAPPQSVYLNGDSTTFEYDQNTLLLNISLAQQPLSEEFIVTWSTY